MHRGLGTYLVSSFTTDFSDFCELVNGATPFSFTSGAPPSSDGRRLIGVLAVEALAFLAWSALFSPATVGGVGSFVPFFFAFA